MHIIRGVAIFTVFVVTACTNPLERTATFQPDEPHNISMLDLRLGCADVGVIWTEEVAWETDEETPAAWFDRELEYELRTQGDVAQLVHGDTKVLLHRRTSSDFPSLVCRIS